jgi:AcrR family transcriptional regulator
MPVRREGKSPTLTERARRGQLIGVTIDLLARHGHAGTSLARIAEAAEISKAAVLYHFPSKDAVVRAAYATVIDGLVAHVGAAVAPLTGAAALEAYIRSMVEYLRDHPAHARVIAEAIGADTVTDTPHAPSRTATVAGLVEAAVDAGDYRPDTDARATAVIVNGAIDAMVAEQLIDPGFDTVRAAGLLVGLLRGRRADEP